jgi:hypothetical protein
MFSSVSAQRYSAIRHTPTAEAARYCFSFPIADEWAPPVSAISPKSPPLLRTRWHHRRPHTTTLFTCVANALNHLVASRVVVTSPRVAAASVGAAPLRGRDVSAKHLVTRPHAPSLLPPPLLAPRAGIVGLQLPSLALCRCYALVHPCVPCGHTQRPPCPAQHSTPMYGQNFPLTCPSRGAWFRCASLSLQRAPPEHAKLCRGIAAHPRA